MIARRFDSPLSLFALPLTLAVVVSGLHAKDALASQRVAGSAALVVHHAVEATFDVSTGRVEVKDRVTLPEVMSGTSVRALLHGGLAPVAEGAELKIVTAETRDTQVKGESRGRIPVDELAITLPAGKREVELRYGGVIQHQPEQASGEYQRSFSETPGIISNDGIYLAGSAIWLPRFGDELHTFDLTIKGLPVGWSAISEGKVPKEVKAPRKKGPEVFRFKSEVPVDDIHVVAGPWVRYAKQIGDVEVLALLRTADDALANKYLEVTGQYLNMYEDLIGEYPYERFALVENFWETGYGMPSFTLLGSKVIRFPFILHSSYPHELLHNWWGNSVFLPEGGGNNWCEGMTAYLADHLVDEQRGRGHEYRQRTLTRYRDFVRPDNDFPLRSFSGRFSPASEAIGYGKWLMVLHMLRRDLGDDAFKQALQHFYRENRFKRATFEEVRASFEHVVGRSLKPFFDAWIDGKGAPEIRWTDARAARNRSGKWSVEISLEQTQGGPLFPMTIPVIVTLDDGRSVEGAVRFDDKREAHASISVPARPARIDIDQAFDTFRVLHRDEVAPSLSLPLGAEKLLFVLPSQASSDETAAWRAFAQSLCPPTEGVCLIKTDEEVKDLPADRAVWILGYGNLMRASAAVGARKYGARFDDGAFVVGPTRQPNGQHALTLAFRHPNNPELGLAFVGAHSLEAIPGLARKLPHYGKYGYLGFNGDEPTNVLKGQWEAVSSPMAVSLRPGADATLRLPRRAPLAELPPPFEANRMVDLVKTLASPEMEGRGYGSMGLEKASRVVEKEFERAGLKPFAGKSFRQCFDDPDGPGKKSVRACNIVGRLPGTNPGLAPVVFSAHLDHLGRGWPEARAGAQGKLHPGANDNASGVAVLVEVARALALSGGLKRDIIVVAFTGEEAGLRGAKHFVTSLGDDPASKVHSVLNLDTVGRKPGKKLLVMGSESAREWPHIFMGVGFVSGIESMMADKDLLASDQRAFVDVGVPAVQIFGGPTADYHRPSDTADKVEPRTLIDVAVVSREVVTYLADRDTPLTSAGAREKAGPAEEGGRKVLVGVVPDFTFQGPGVLLSGVTDDSPAQKAGLEKGDIVIKFDGQDVENLRHYAGLLRNKKAGDKVKVVVKRGDATLERELLLVAR